MRTSQCYNYNISEGYCDKKNHDDDLWVYMTTVNHSKYTFNYRFSSLTASADGGGGTEGGHVCSSRDVVSEQHICFINLEIQ